MHICTRVGVFFVRHTHTLTHTHARAFARARNYRDSTTRGTLTCFALLSLCLGDAIMAIWNAPYTTINHPVKACEAALLCSSRLAVLQPGMVTGKARAREMYGLKRDVWSTLGLRDYPGL